MVSAIQKEIVEKERVDFLANTNTKGHTALDLFCIQLQGGVQPTQALRGIAILICNGAEIPVNPLLRSLLMQHRKALYQEVKRYTNSEKAPHLALNFLRRCHLKGNALHDVMYAKHSWSQAFRHFFGSPDDFAFQLETLVPSIPAPDKPEYVLEMGLAKEEALFAAFVSRYKESFRAVTFFNPWSGMRHRLAKGEITCWTDVMAYAATYPRSRSAQIVTEMQKLTINVHENLDTVSRMPSV